MLKQWNSKTLKNDGHPREHHIFSTWSYAGPFTHRHAGTHARTHAGRHARRHQRTHVLRRPSRVRHPQGTAPAPPAQGNHADRRRPSPPRPSLGPGPSVPHPGEPRQFVPRGWNGASPRFLYLQGFHPSPWDRATHQPRPSRVRHLRCCVTMDPVCTPRPGLAPSNARPGRWTTCPKTTSTQNL